MIEHGDGSIWAIEVKRALSARVERGFHLACADISPTRAYVAHAGDDRYTVSGAIEGVGVRRLAEELLALSGSPA